MPKLRASTEQIQINEFCDWVRGTAKRKGITQRQISDEMLISEVSLSNKLNGRTSISIKDIIQMCALLGGYTFGHGETE